MSDIKLDQQNILEPTLKEKTARGLFWGGVSNGVQQVLGVVFGIFLARVLNAEDYGLVGMLAIFSSIASTIINSGFSVALTNKVNATHKDFNAVFWFSFFTGLILYVILYFCAPLIASFFNRPELISLSRVLFISFFFGGLAIVPHTVLFKKLMVKEQAKIDITAMLLSGIVGVSLAIKGFAYWALALQSMTYIVIGSVLRFFVSRWQPTFDLDFKPLKEMFPFSINLFATNIFQQINSNLFSVLLGRFYNATQLGYYAQGNKWMGMGNQIISGMVTQVAQPVLISVKDDKERETRVLRKMIRFTAFVTFPAFIGLAFIAREFILISIGEKWIPSILYLQILCIWGIISPFVVIFSQLVISHGKSRIYLLGNLLTGGLQLFTLIILYGIGSEIVYMVVGYVVSYFCSLLFWFYSSKKWINMSIASFMKDIIPYLSVSLISWGFSTSIISLLNNIYWILTMKILLMSFMYISILWLLNSKLLKESLSLLRRKKDE